MAVKKTDKPAVPKPVLDLRDLARRVGETGTVWVKTGLNFDHPGIEVASIAVVIDGPDGGRSITLQSYNGSVGKAASRLESLETNGKPIRGQVADALARLERRGYRIVAATDTVAPATKKTRARRKAGDGAAPAASGRRRGRRKAD